MVKCLSKLQEIIIIKKMCEKFLFVKRIFHLKKEFFV